MSTSIDVARSYCSLFGLDSALDGKCPEGTELIVLNRLDWVALMGTLALLPETEALVDISTCDIVPERMVELGIWGCVAGDAEQVLKLLRFRMACGRSMLIDQEVWSLIREGYDFPAPVVFGTAELEDQSTMRVRFAEPESEQVPVSSRATSNWRQPLG